MFVQYSDCGDWTPAANNGNGASASTSNADSAVTSGVGSPPSAAALAMQRRSKEEAAQVRLIYLFGRLIATPFIHLIDDDVAASIRTMPGTRVLAAFGDPLSQ